MISNAIHLSELKVGVIINASSGSYDSKCEDKMVDMLKGARITEAKIWCGDADQMERSFTEAARQKLEVLIVLAGDGTIRTAAERCGAARSFLIPLPGGTMNMLARALYGDRSWEDALEKTLAAPSAKALSGGRVAEKQFFIAAIVGAPTLWTEARESLRERDIGDAIEKGNAAFRNMFETKVRYFISGKKRVKLKPLPLFAPSYRKKCPIRNKHLRPRRLRWKTSLK